MPRSLTFYYDYISPYTYMAWTQIEAIARRAQASIDYRPFRLGELMRQVGNRPTTIECANKGKYAARDLARWAGRYQVEFTRNPNWGKFDHLPMLRGALAAIDQGCIEPYNKAMFRAMWVESANLGERDTFSSTLGRVGLDGNALAESAFSDQYEERLAGSVKEAAERGVFGSPTFFVGEEQFFGNDRLDFVQQALAA